MSSMREALMTEFVIITANDIHISDNGPRSRIDNFKETVLDKIEQMCMACNKLNADAAIIAGDLFNLKNPTRNSHNLNQELIRAFGQFECPIYMIEGNHDLTANRLESLEDQPLGVLFADKTLIQLREEIIEKNGVKISLVGVPYIEGLDLNTLQIPDKGDCVSQICAMHLYAGLKGGMLYKERLYGYDELGVFSPDIFVLGHYHIDQGIYQENGKYFINIGSMTRGTLSEEDIDHNPQIGFIKINVENNKPIYTLRSINLKVKMAADIFDLERREQEDQENEEMKLFVEKLASEAVEESANNNTQSINDLIGAMDMAKIVRDRVIYFMQEASVK